MPTKTRQDPLTRVRAAHTRYVTQVARERDRTARAREALRKTVEAAYKDRTLREIGDAMNMRRQSVYDLMREKDKNSKKKR